MTEQLVAVLNQGIVDTRSGVASADDAGLVRGDGCFDATLLDASGTIWDLEEHLERLGHSCELMGLRAPELDAWRALIDEAVAAWQGGEAALKLVTTRGPEHGGEPTSFLTITALPPAMVDQREGISVITLDRGYSSSTFDGKPWLLGGAKTLSYAVHTAAKREAQARGADDVLFMSSDGFVLEAPTAAVVWRVGDRYFSTPTGGTGILDSISRRKVFTGVGDRAEFALATPDDLVRSDGVWLLSSVRGTAPVLSLDGTPIAHDADQTHRIRDLNGF